MNPLPARASFAVRGGAISFAVLFLLFLSLSQPHRVHHFFEGHTHSHDEGEADSEHGHHGTDQTKPVQTNCAVQSVIQNCHLGEIDLLQLRFTGVTAASLHPPLSPWVDSVALIPFLRRAPPAAALLF
jgi:hypothetical protein